MADSPPPRRYRLAPAHLLVLLLATEGLLWLSERYGWFAFDEHKGWTVLIAIGAVLATAALLLLWLALALVFRRRFQFGLRTLFLLMLVVAVPCSWLAVQMKAARKQREAIAAVEPFSMIDYDFQGDGLDEPVTFVSPALSAWLRERLGEDFFADVVTVESGSFASGMTDSMVKLLIDNCPALYNLDLLGSQVTDVGIRALYGLRRLGSLDLGDTTITDESLRTIGKMTQLEDLRLAGTGITDNGVRNLERLTALRYLDLGRTKITDKSFVIIAQFQELRGLQLSETRITDAALKVLATLHQLQHLDLRLTSVSDMGLEQLHGCYHYATLWMEGTEATDRGIEMLKKSLPDCEVQTGIRLDKP